MKQLRILIITQLFPSGENTQHSSHVIKDFAMEWAKLGHHVSVFRPYYSYEKELFPAQNPYHLLPNLMVTFFRPFRVPLLKISIYPLRNILNRLEEKPDVLVCHMYNSYFTFYKLAVKLNIPLVIGVHMSDIRLADNWFYRQRQNHVFRYAKGIACRSEAYHRQFKDLFPQYSDKSLATSGIPATFLGKRIVRSASSELAIITVGSLIKRKQVDKVIDCLTSLPGEISWKYTIIGDGPERPRLMELINRYNLQDKVRVLGQMVQSQVFEMMTISDVFILPSYQETLGLVYLEAMAAGCVVIGSLNEGIDGIIQHGHNGFLCNPFDDGSILSVLTKALSINAIEKEILIQNAFDTVSNYSTAAKASEYLTNIKKLV